MELRLDHFRLALCSSAVLALAGCGGGDGDGSTPPAPVATTTNVSTTVVDGAILNALVCLDKNLNGVCEADEVQGRTDVDGKVTLAVPNGDVNKYPIIAVVGTDAIDADHGSVTTAYMMSTPADQPGVVSPLTTLVQQTVASTGATTAEAAKSVQDATGIVASLFQDFTKVAAPTDGSASAATVARLLVVTTQQQNAVVAAAVGTLATDGTTITQADLDKAIQKKLLELLPSLVAALNDPAVLAATTSLEREAALLASATALVTTSGLTPAAIATVVAINTQAASTTPVASANPAPFIQLASLSFGNATSYNVRLFTGSLAQNTPDSANNSRYVERRIRVTGTSVAQWGAGGDPVRGADLNWNGSAWVGCPINFENTSSVRDAQGNNSYSYCDKRETGKGSRATFDIANKTMAEVYAQIRTAGYTNQFIADSSVLGSATFPTGSALFYQSGIPLTNAISYYPAGANSPAGFSNVVSQYSAAVSGGGVATTQAVGVACNNTVETNTNGTSSITLEAMVAAKGGTPCVFGPSSFVYGGVTYVSGDLNEWWGNSTVSLGKLGSVPINFGVAPGFYSGNTFVRIAFKGTGTNPVTYYACQERFNNGSVRNCAPIGTGSYSIQTLGDGRAMTLTNPPALAASLTYNRVFVERGGFVYLGYQNKPTVTNSARLNTVAAGALLAQLGVPAVDPSAPLALTAGSYAGTWDIRGTDDPVAPNIGTTIFINANGSSSCQEKENNTGYACTVTITDAATGAFTVADSSGSAAGSFNFLAGTTSGTYVDQTSTPSTGSFIGGRR